MTQMHIPGIDVSQYQGNITWAKVAQAGIKWAYIRANCGTRVDTHVSRNLKLSKKRGIPRGVYVYFKPEQDVAKQARILLSYNTDCELEPMIDVEHHGDLKPKEIVAALQQIVDIVTTATGKPPVIYTGAWFWNVRVKSKKFGHCPLWVSQYVHYDTQSYRIHPVPDDPKDWTKYAYKHPRPKPIIGWSKWLYWQFSAGYNGVGKKYGMESRDLDLNLKEAI